MKRWYYIRLETPTTASIIPVLGDLTEARRQAYLVDASWEHVWIRCNGRTVDTIRTPSDRAHRWIRTKAGAP